MEAEGETASQKRTCEPNQLNYIEAIGGADNI